MANAARECGFDADGHQQRRRIPQGILGAPAGRGRPGPWNAGIDGVELLRFLADEDFQGPVLIISGFDRRVLESAFRLGEAQGLNMAGPLEKPVRLEELEELLESAQAGGAFMTAADRKLLESFERALAQQELCASFISRRSA